MAQRLSKDSLFDTGRDVIEDNLKFTSNHFMLSRAEDLMDEKRPLDEDELGCFGRVGKFIDTLIIGTDSHKALLTQEERVNLISECDARDSVEFVFIDSLFKDNSFSLDELDEIKAKLVALKEANQKIIESKSTDVGADLLLKDFIHKMQKKYFNAMLRENYKNMNCMPW